MEKGFLGFMILRYPLVMGNCKQECNADVDGAIDLGIENEEFGSHSSGLIACRVP